MPAPISPSCARLFQHLDRKALAHQGQRGRQAADAAAGDQYGKGFGSLLHVVSNRRGAASCGLVFGACRETSFGFAHYFVKRVA